jgi:hypothetical protein
LFEKSELQRLRKADWGVAKGKRFSASEGERVQRETERYTNLTHRWLRLGNLASGGMSSMETLAMLKVAAPRMMYILDGWQVCA